MDFIKRHLNIFVLTAVLFAQLLLVAGQVRKPSDQGSTSKLRLWAVAAISPIERMFVHAQDSVVDTWKNYFYLRGIRKENEELKAQLDQLRIEQVRLREDANQARRIQALLGFKEQFVSKTVAAQVIGTSGSEMSRLLYIDKGEQDGVQPNMAVITPTGIVGKVLRVRGNTSQVLEITDQTSGVGALLVKSRLQGILNGSPSGDLKLSYIMSDEKVDGGEEIVTSGGDGIFPKGLPVGTVISSAPGRDMFLNVRVRPAADLTKLEEVLVITEVSQKAPDTKDLGPIRASDILAERLPTVPQQQKDANGNPIPNPSTSTPAPNAAQPQQQAPAAGTTTAPGAQGGAAKPGAPSGTGATGAAKPATNTATPAGAGAGTSAPRPKPATTGTTGTTTTGTGSPGVAPNTVRRVPSGTTGATGAASPKTTAPAKPAQQQPPAQTRPPQ